MSRLTKQLNLIPVSLPSAKVAHASVGERPGAGQFGGK